MKSVCHSLADSVQRDPDRIAVHESSQDHSYGQIWTQAIAVAEVLSAHGVTSGERVALLLANGSAYMASYFGIQMAGGVAVTLNANTSTRELGQSLTHCQPRAAIIGRIACDALVGCLHRLPELSLIVVSGPNDRQLAELAGQQATRQVVLYESLRERSTASEPRRWPRPEQLAQIIYTSGTSGHPKGVTLSHHNLAVNTASIIDYLHLTAADRVQVILPFSYSYGNSLLLTHAAVGGRLIIAGDFVFLNRLLDLMESQQATGFAGVPSSFAMLLHQSNFAQRTFPDLRYVTCAGGALPAAHVERLREQLPHVELFLMYGQTEATARLSTLMPEELDTHPGSIGRGISGVTLEVRNEMGMPAAVDEMGELVARGENVMAGYWNDPRQTDHVLHDGVLWTGDLARRDAKGYFYLVGRRSDMIKFGAYRLHPGELEEVILEIPGIAEVAVVGVRDAMFGEIPVALIVPTSDESMPTLDAVQRYLAQQLPRHKTVREVHQVQQLEKTSSGKIRRRELARRLEEDR